MSAINVKSWYDGTYFTVFIVGMKYISVLHSCAGFEDVVAAIMEEAGERKTPFVIVSSSYIGDEIGPIVDNELATITIGV